MKTRYSFGDQSREMNFRRIKKCKQLFKCNAMTGVVLLFVVCNLYILTRGTNTKVQMWNWKQAKYALSIKNSFHQESLEITSETPLVSVREVYIKENRTKKQVNQAIFKRQDDMFDSINERMTIVTAYFDLGIFKKGHSRKYEPNLYFDWSKPLAHIVNPLVVYTDSETFANLVKTYRERFPLKTKILIIERNSTWAFQLVGLIRSVFSQPGYPKYYPNTVSPEYSCVQHVKFNLVADAVRRKYFDTEFYAWLDVGYFKKYRSSTQYFRLETPPNMDKTKIAFNRVKKRDMLDHPRAILRNKISWVGGGMFIGTQDMILKFEEMYLRALKYFLNQNWMNTDQQVLYSIYSVEGRKLIQPEVELQLYARNSTNWEDRDWYYLGDICRHRIPLLMN